MDERISLGRLFKQARESQSVSQLYVASCLGQRSPSFISRLEKGTQVPSPKTARVLARVLGISRRDLVERLVAVERVRIIESIGNIL